MPIEIKELHIRVTVNTSETTPTPSGTPDVSTKQPGVDQTAIVAECVEQILQILREKTER